MKVPIKRSDRYAPVSDLWVVTSYFNSNGYETKRKNYAVFEASLLGAGINLVTIECAFGDTDFELPLGRHVKRVRCKDVMWQKERLLNVVIGALPKRCLKVAWLDCDIVFENDEWAVMSSRLLDDVVMLQPFDRAVRLPRDQKTYAGEGITYDSFAAVLNLHPNRHLEAKFEAHGHTGFGWAARKELLLKHGLFDVSIAGSADHIMAHAVCGDWSSVCVDRTIGMSAEYRRRFEAWAKGIAADVDGRIGVVPGLCQHLWHGEIAERRYDERNRDLAKFGFDPSTDLRIAPSGCWEWASDKPELHAWAVEYFKARNEDGRAAGAVQLCEVARPSIEWALLPDAVWRSVEPILLDRLCFEAALWMLATNARWKNLPARFPSADFCIARIRHWSERGLWAGMWRRYLMELPLTHHTQWSRVFANGGTVEGTDWEGDPQLRNVYWTSAKLFHASWHAGQEESETRPRRTTRARPRLRTRSRVAR